MQVKEIYLDLREWEQYAKNNNNVWTLTSEAFKDPLVLKLVYDKSDEKRFQSYVEKCNDVLKILQEKQKDLDEKIQKQQHIIEEISRIRDNENELLRKSEELLFKNKDCYNRILDLEDVENENKTILLNKINKINSYLEENQPKKILRYHGEELINGLDPYYWEIEIPAWKYITIESITIHPQNEFVLNEDQTTYKTIVVEDTYDLAIQLIGSNAIDKPTALVELDILFFQI